MKLGILGAGSEGGALNTAWAQFWGFMHLPPIGNETELHLDLASAAIALLALAFSIYTWRHQKKMRELSIAAQRDAGLIRWTESAIDAVVASEFLLRSWTADADAAQYARDRDEHLAKLAAVIDKGRLYFPWFARDIVEGQAAPAADLVEVNANASPVRIQLPILDDLVEIYDLIRTIDFGRADMLSQTRTEVMKKKRHFVLEAQKKVEFRRQPGFIE
jgi:hypothetical protein